MCLVSWIRIQIRQNSLDRCKFADDMCLLQKMLHTDAFYNQEVKPADLILASYGCFLSTPSNGGRCEYIHINLCKSAKLRVHLIEQTYSTDMRVEVLQPTIRTALTPLPTIDNFTTVWNLCI